MPKAASRTALSELKRRLAAVFVRSKLDITDDLLVLTALLRDLRWKVDTPASKIRGIWEAFLKDKRPRGHFFELYMHIPFCQRKCLYCVYPSRPSGDEDELRRYVPELKSEIRYFSRPFSRTRFRTFMVGGGTPSLLSASQLEAVLGEAFARFKFERGGFRSIELNPASVTPEKLLAARRAGMNRASFGVQSFDPAVLRKNGRENQRPEMVRDAVRWARGARYEDINLDLIFGLYGDTPRTFLDSFEKAAALKPHTITVAGLTLTDGYMRAMGTTREACLRRYDRLLSGTLGGLRGLCRRKGYDAGELSPERGIWTLYSRDLPDSVRERYREGDSYPGGPSSILGLGHYARSHVFGRALYDRRPGRFTSRSLLYRTARLTPKEEMAHYILDALENHSRISRAEFRARFGADVAEAFGLELKVLKALGKVRVGPRAVAFLPEFCRERIFYTAVFLLETLAASRFSRGELGPDFLARLGRELAAVSLEARR